MKTLLYISILLIFISNTTFICCDILYLKNGGKAEGLIEDKGTHYEVANPYGVSKFKKNEVEKIVSSPLTDKNDTKTPKTIDKDFVRDIKKTVNAKKRHKTAVNRAFHEDKFLEIGTHGERIDIKKYLVTDKITVFDFSSPYCGHCKNYESQLKELIRTRDDIFVRKININRPDIKGIDWKSPLVIQYNIKNVPYFIIYRADGTFWLKARAAKDKVDSWIK